MAQVEIYTANYCPYCDRAKTLLKKKGVQYKEYDATSSDTLREEAMQRSGGRKTVPQIFIDKKHIGGFDDISALEKEGKLDALLAS